MIALWFCKGVYKVSAIHQALGTLVHTVESLEKAATSVEKKVARMAKEKAATPLAGQIDMFAASKATPANVYKFDPGQVAKKLDLAIEKVEKMLQEG